MRKAKEQKQKVHFIHKTLLNPTNPIMVNLIGAGGTGSQVLTALARINHSLNELGHAGLFVRLYDDDIVTTANQGRQLFADAEVGLNKAVALINRINRFFGTAWKAMPLRFNKENVEASTDHSATLTISCVDTVNARFDIAAILNNWKQRQRYSRNEPLYWMDFGNSQYTGQLTLATIGKHDQPKSKHYKPVATLPAITEEYKDELQRTDETDTPSCSLAEALLKQDLFINSSLASLGASLLWQMFREGMITHRGFFLNLKDLRTLPVII